MCNGRGSNHCCIEFVTTKMESSKLSALVFFFSLSLSLSLRHLLSKY